MGDKTSRIAGVHVYLWVVDHALAAQAPTAN